MEKSAWKELRFEGPATYRICFRGALDEYWSEFLGGMRMSSRKLGEQQSVTELEGRLLDQAALAGVLNTLYDMHCPIISVTYLEQDSGADTFQKTS